MAYEPKYFKRSDFFCKCIGHCKHDKTVTDKQLIALDKLRDKAGEPLYVNCGVRCPKHNDEVGGEPESYHLACMATDIRAKTLTPKQLAKIAETIPEFNAGGIGIYSTFVHVDTRKYKARWHG